MAFGRFIINDASSSLCGRYLESSQARVGNSILGTVFSSNFLTTPSALAEYPEGNELNDLGLNCSWCPQQFGGDGRLCKGGLGCLFYRYNH